jgi:hypothetical protein
MSGRFGRTRRRAGIPAEVQEDPSRGLRIVLAENKMIKDKVAALCRQWKARSAHGATYARELESAMGWTPDGDPLTGCQPVTPSGPATG